MTLGIFSIDNKKTRNLPPEALYEKIKLEANEWYIILPSIKRSLAFEYYVDNYNIINFSSSCDIKFYYYKSNDLDGYNIIYDLRMGYEFNFCSSHLKYLVGRHSREIIFSDLISSNQYINNPNYYTRYINNLLCRFSLNRDIHELTTFIIILYFATKDYSIFDRFADVLKGNNITVYYNVLRIIFTRHPTIDNDNIFKYINYNFLSNIPKKILVKLRKYALERFIRDGLYSLQFDDIKSLSYTVDFIKFMYRILSTPLDSDLDLQLSNEFIKIFREYTDCKFNIFVQYKSDDSESIIKSSKNTLDKTYMDAYKYLKSKLPDVFTSLDVYIDIF